ncbi:hypothetical protein L596_010234 [Steinernema carpocapsae]|nr:hypothetical protein L596_010234 [Steinernema carpocapsae]
MMSLRKSPRRKAEMDKPAPKKVVDKKKAAVKAPLPLEPEREKLAKNGFQKSSKKTPVVKIPRPRGRPRRATIESRHVIKKEPKTSKKKKAVEPSPNRSSSEELEAPSTKFVALDPVEKEEFLKQPLVVEQPPEEDDDEKTLSSVSSVTTSDGELEDER